MSADLVLVQPPLPANERHKKVFPLGLAYLAARARERLPGLSIRVIDGQAHNLPVAAVVEAAARLAGERTVVGIGYWTCQAPAARAISAGIRRAVPRAMIVHGGVHPTIFPAEALETADLCVLNEGEETLCDILRHRLGGSPRPEEIPGLALREGGEVRRMPPRDFIEDLDAVPFPAWDLFDMERYDSPLHVVGGRRLPIIGSRGCPYGCTYCGSPLMWKRRVRWRSPENILGEIKASIAALGIDQFHFWDDNLMLDRRHIERLCRLIVEERLRIRWTGLTRASHVARNGDLMGLLREAGCIGLEVGIESANPDTFAAIHKDEDLRLIREVARLHKAHGMSPLFTFMAFNPGETITGYYRQARFIDDLIAGLPWYEHFHMFPFPLYVGQFSTAHPGTELHAQAPSLGEVLAEGWEQYHHHEINFVPRSLLGDVPARNAAEMGEYHYRLCNFAAQVVLWGDFNRSVPVARQREVLTRLRDFLDLFWRSCDGRRTVMDICARAMRRQGLSRKDAIRFGALACLVLGQVGLIVSAADADRGAPPIMEVAKPDEIPIMMQPDPRPSRAASILSFLRGARARRRPGGGSGAKGGDA
ncbi:MAG: radical SAM protein [bacterium]|nr:radical SAM protein [bacterium]